MYNLLCSLKADYLKTKHTPLRMAHLVIPCAMAAVFLAYYAVAPWNAYSKVQAYFQMMGMGFPLLIGTFCAIVAEQEAYAGAYQMMLAVTDRKSAFIAKLTLLILFGAASVVLASVLFGTGCYFVLKQHVVQYSFYWIGAFAMAGGSIFLYVWHMFLALRFHNGISVGLGIAESLMAAVCLTGLGDSIWIFLPAAWSSRVVCSMMPAYSEEQFPVSDYSRGIWICAVVTVAALILYVMWGCKWEGAKGNE
ncbi:MAG: lantibiotic immunity ABC transporter MutG family permease subunit [Lachnospiraceae bacterium]|nr:lantibiotic immunity ABC transporter MutG family permease subunit [Lachnospiraceae bacterium]